MSIIIQNIDKNLRPKGRHHYVLRINQKRVAEFYHNREDGLAECLRRAAVAAEDPRRSEVMDRHASDAAFFEAIAKVEK